VTGRDVIVGPVLDAVVVRLLAWPDLPRDLGKRPSASRPQVSALTVDAVRPVRRANRSVVRRSARRSDEEPSRAATSNAIA